MTKPEGRAQAMNINDTAARHAGIDIRRPIPLAGYLALAAAIVYVLATLAGSLLDPSYSQIRQHVSDLTATGAPTWAALAPPYLLYNVLAAAFAIELYRVSDGGRLWLFGTVFLLINAVAGGLMVTLFREDIGGIPTTSAGAGHLVFAGLSSVAILVASLLYGVAFRRSTTWRGLSTFSFIVVGLGSWSSGPWRPMRRRRRATSPDSPSGARSVCSSYGSSSSVRTRSCSDDASS
jgi:Protein of unknown function (DUF998)